MFVFGSMPVFRRAMVGCVWLALVAAVQIAAIGQQPKEADSDLSVPAATLSSLRIQASESLRAGKLSLATAAADAMITDYGDDVQAIAAAGDIYLRSGKVQKSVRQFDRLVNRQPSQMPYLWQRGIALYFAGKYDEAADQFAKHRRVNPNDVENAAWHFLCIAKDQSPEKAKQMVLPAPGDGREPMNEVLAMLSSGDTQSVRARIDQVHRDSPGSRSAKEATFYGELYLGLYADAWGDLAEAKARMDAACRDTPPHYMGDVARVYAEHLRQSTVLP
ncbi:lipoprotein NlpI [Rubripirellula lacrimiformis]|uniref:Lipoprotein NlpI n=2 Tax=Rubripirellula lacrimiformis TaxID=1930273 RepID=A0A517N9U6_9BACT|nr:lipoprotein NlpI [Rubripirellula lacrimiformis]